MPKIAIPFLSRIVMFHNYNLLNRKKPEFISIKLSPERYAENEVIHIYI